MALTKKVDRPLSLDLPNSYDKNIYSYDPDILMMDVAKKKYRHENHVKDSVKKILDTFRGAFHWPVGASATGSRTVDRMCVYRGYSIAIEVKYGKNKPTDLQRIFLTKHEKAGGLSICVWETNLEQLFLALQYMSQLPFGGFTNPEITMFSMNVTDICNTACTYRDLETIVR